MEPVSPPKVGRTPGFSSNLFETQRLQEEGLCGWRLRSNGPPNVPIWSPWVTHRVTSPDPSFLILEIKPLNTGVSNFTIHPTPALKDWYLCPRSNSLRKQTWDTSISESGLPPQVRGSFIYPKKENLILSEMTKRQGHVYNQDAFSDNGSQCSSVSILHYSPKTTL